MHAGMEHLCAVVRPLSDFTVSILVVSLRQAPPRRLQDGDAARFPGRRVHGAHASAHPHGRVRPRRSRSALRRLLSPRRTMIARSASGGRRLPPWWRISRDPVVEVLAALEACRQGPWDPLRLLSRADGAAKPTPKG